MIEQVRGWTRTVYGGSVFQTPSDWGDEPAGIRYQERIRPLGRALEIVRALPLPPGAELLEVSAPRPIVTDEGEYAVLVAAPARHDGAVIHRFIGLVFVDDFYAQLLGHVRRPEAAPAFASLVEELVRGTRHFMPLRRRRFVHAPPPGWQGILLEGQAARWMPPDYPRRALHIDVYPALPLGGGDPVEAFQGMLGEIDIRARTEARPVHGRGDLAGDGWSLVVAEAGRERFLELALLVDDRFVYPVVQTSSTREPARELAELVATIEPIPRARARRHHGGIAMSNWAD